MRERKDLQALLESLLGSKNVYYQPPANLYMKYPCIVYHLDMGETHFANDRPYVFSKRYSVTLIDKNPDSLFIEKLAALPMCLFDRGFSADNLNHFLFTLYF